MICIEAEASAHGTPILFTEKGRAHREKVDADFGICIGKDHDASSSIVLCMLALVSVSSFDLVMNAGEIRACVFFLYFACSGTRAILILGAAIEKELKSLTP